MLKNFLKYSNLLLGLLLSVNLAHAVEKPASAIPVAQDTPYADFLTEAGQSKWYVMNNATAAKLTFKQDNTKLLNANYDLRVYRLDTVGNTLVEEVASTLPGGMNEQVGKQAAAASVWYAKVSSASGFDSANSFSLSWNANISAPDPQEPDDSPVQAKAFPYQPGVVGRVQGTHDNPNDLDWYKYTVPTSGLFNLILSQGWDATGKPLPTTQTVVELYDQNFKLLNTWPLFKLVFDHSLQAGVYYFKIYSTSKSSGFSYSLGVLPKVAPVAARVTINNVTSEGGVQGFINYGLGSKWRVKGGIGIYGKAFDANGVAIAKAEVSVAVRPVLNQTPTVASVLTDAEGNFVLNMNLPPAAGGRRFDNGISWHYYDVIPVSFTSSGRAVTANIADFYHFAYQILK